MSRTTDVTMRRLGRLALGLSWLAIASTVEAEPVGRHFVAPQGCGMAHCDRHLSDAVRLLSPRGVAFVRWRDSDAGGSQYGLGCSSNGTVAVCSFGNASEGQPNVAAYDSDGVRRWSSSLLNSTAWASAPMVDRFGGAIAADNTTIVRYNLKGDVLWATPTPGGAAISPNITDDGAVVLAAYNGPLSAYDVTTGAALGELWLNETLVIDGQDVPGFFDTINTPSVAGNRVYVSTQFHRSDEGLPVFVGRLYAIDVLRPDPSGPAQFAVAWYVQFLAPSGASPLLVPEGPEPVVYFDGAGPHADGPPLPTLFAVRDHGTTYSLRWQVAMPGKLQASAARDPRGGLWVWPADTSKLLRLSMVTGAIRQTLDVDSLVNEDGVHMPSSAMSMSMSGQTPVMVVSAWTKTTTGSSYVIAIDLAAGSLLWKIALGSSPDSVAFGQYPILIAPDGRPIIVFSTYGGGVWGVAAE